MNKSFLKIAAVILFSVLCFVGGIFYQKQRPQEMGTSRTKMYAGKGFMLDYPTYIDEIQETTSTVIFHQKNWEDLTGFGVVVTSTQIESTKEWLESQPKGSASQAGYELLFWLGSGKAIVAEYVVVDHDREHPIYGKRIYMIYRGLGGIYKLDFPGEQRAEDIPNIDPERLDIANSFGMDLGVQANN